MNAADFSALFPTQHAQLRTNHAIWSRCEIISGSLSGGLQVGWETFDHKAQRVKHNTEFVPAKDIVSVQYYID